MRKKNDIEETYDDISAPTEERVQPPLTSDEIAPVQPPLTPDELAIFHRVASEDKDWETIGEKSVVDFSLSRDPFELPPPAKQKVAEKKMAFRWITRNPARIDTVRNQPVPLRWWLCNSTNTPFLQKHIDPILGCVCILDQVLVFKPWWMHEKEMALYRQMADNHDQGRSLLAMDGEVRETARGGEAEFIAKSRMSSDSRSSGRHEVRGGDIVEADEATIDAAMGITHGELSTEDFRVND